MKKLILFVGVCVGILSAQIANAESPVWGTYKVECPANSDTYIGITTTRAPVFTGKVQSVQSGTTNIVAQGEPNWSANQFVYVAGSQTNHYYLKFTSGELEGAWYDIKSNGAYFAEIEIGSAELAKVKANDTFQIIPHWTLATLFPNGGGFVSASSMSNSSTLWKYTSWSETNGVEYTIGTDNAFKKSYYYRKGASKSAWCNAAGKVVSDEVIEPNAFFLVVQPSTPSTVCYSSVVPMSPTSIDVYVSADSDQDIYFPVPSAVDMTVADLNEALIDSKIFTSSESSQGIDWLLIYNNKKTGRDVPADLICYHRSKNSRQQWCNIGGSNVNTSTLKAGGAIIFQKKTTGEERIARIVFKPNYIK